MDVATLKRYTSSQKRKCKHCMKSFNIKGATSHEKACGKKLETRLKDLAYEKSLATKGRMGSEGTSYIYKMKGNSSKKPYHRLSYNPRKR